MRSWVLAASLLAAAATTGAQAADLYDGPPAPRYGSAYEDLAFVYHTGEEKSVVGIAKITKDNYPDPKDNEWVAVEIAPINKLKNPVGLAQIKADKRFINMVLVRASRLSVQPVKKEEFDMIVALSEQKS